MMNKIMVLGCLLTTLASFGQQLKGTVVDANTNKGIPFAKIYVMDIQSGTVADSIGYFEFDNTIPNDVTLRVTAPLYEAKLVPAQKNGAVAVSLKSSHLEVDEIVVIVPSGQLARNNTVRVERMDLKDLNLIPATSLPDAIANINGVQVSSVGPGITKPVIRGLQGVRVVTLLNGMRIENQQWGGDHGMGISQLGLGAVEVIKGPSSLLYGADAYGGVVYLQDAKFANVNSYEAFVQSKFNSVNMGTTNSGMLKLSKNNMRLSVAGLYSSFADFEVPSGQYVINSRYTNRGAKARFGYNREKWSMQMHYMFSDSYVGIPGHTHDANPVPEDFLSSTQNRRRTVPVQAIQNHFVSMDNRFFFKKHQLDLMLGYTYNNLAEFEEKVTIPGIDMVLNNGLYHAKMHFNFNSAFKVVAGLQGMYQENRNQPNALEDLVDDFNLFDNGAYGVAYWNGPNSLSAQLGARVDVRNLESGDFTQTYVNPSFAAGLKFEQVNSNANRNIVRLNVSSGFRAPHPTELLIDGVHHGALRYEKGNTDLRPEQALQVDLDYELEQDHISVVINPFYNYITDYIQIEEQDSLIDGVPLYNFVQLDQAQLYGVDASLHYHPHFAHWLHLESGFSIIYGESLSGEDISLMPQPKWNNLVKVEFAMGSKFKVKELVMQYQYFMAQDRVSQYETASSAYQLFDVGVNMRWAMKTPLDIQLGVKNAFNENYVNHLSRLKNIGVSEPGRNFYIQMKYTIPGKLKTNK